MKSDELLDAIGEARDEYVHDVRNAKVKKMPGRAKWTSAIAACLVLTIGVGLFFGGMGGNAGSGGDDDLNYMYYVGPVLPLSVQGENPGICAVRNVNYDFSPYRIDQNITDSDRYYAQAIITDSYVLTNESGADQTLTLLHPQIGSLCDYANEGMYPSFTVNGQTTKAEFHPGPDTGAFQSLEYAPPNLIIDNFEGYQHLLSDGSYLASALDDFPILDQKVIVYQLSDYTYTADETASNPTIEMSFLMDYEKSYVFTYGMNIGPITERNGMLTCRVGSIEYNPDLPAYYQEPREAYLILMGEDIAGYSIQGYRDGSCNDGEELDDLRCNVTRYETTFGVILYEAVQDYLEYRLPLRFSEAIPGSTEQYCGLVAEALETHGILNQEPDGRSAWGNLEPLIDATHTGSRIIYFSIPVTIPGGEQITVEATMRKDASIDYIGKDTGKYGYDMATRLGSNLIFTEQTASISSFEDIEIVAQNFGFDLTNDITCVTLDLNQEHYWMEIRKLPKDFWIIWTGTFLFLSAVGIITELVVRSRNQT